MKEYDSILKEEKVYKDPVVVHHKYTKYIVIYILMLILILGGSYIVYYQTILSPNNIIVNDLATILSPYKNVYQNILPKNVLGSPSLEGTILLENHTYNYGIIREKDLFLFELSNQNTSLLTKLTPQKNYTELSSFQKQNITQDNPINFNKLTNLKDNLNNSFQKEKIIKNLYFKEKVPVVELNLSLTEKDINAMLDSSFLKDQYEFLITIKNNAFTNQIISIKVIMNNKSKNTRSTLEYQNKKIIYKNSQGKKYRLEITNHQKDFHLKIYQDDELYSILLGKEFDYSYTYTYQIIDKIYTIELKNNIEKDGYIYELSSKIEKNGVEHQQNLKINLRKSGTDLLEESVAKNIEYQALTKENKIEYKKQLDLFLAPLREFMKEYENNVDRLDQEQGIS